MNALLSSSIIPYSATQLTAVAASDYTLIQDNFTDGVGPIDARVKIRG